jgi:hypothetical protein
MMPQLKKFQKTGNCQYNNRNSPGFSFAQEKRKYKTPEYYIKYASKRIVDPVFGRPIVKLAVEANRNNHKNRN